MSDNQLDEFRNKVSQSKSLVNEIFDLYKNVAGSEVFHQNEQQLHEVNRAITNLQNINTPVPDALREIKNQITNNLAIKTEADQILSDFKNVVYDLFNSVTVPKKRKSKGGFSKLDDTESLEVVLDICSLVINDGLKISKAFLSVAKKHNISASAVRVKCSRYIGLNIKTFRSYLTNNNATLYDHLIKTFPQEVQKIKIAIGK